MTKAAFIKTLAGFVPASAEAEKLHKGVKLGKQVMLDVRNARHPGHHSKMFALLQKTADNLPGERTPYQLLTALKHTLGMFTAIPMKGGHTAYCYESISFESMSQDDFQVFYDSAVAILAEALGVTPDELKNEVRDVI